MNRLEGRTAVITGAGSGIGLASARRLASEGAKIVIADVDDVAGQAAATEVEGTFVRTDVTDADAVDALFAAAHATYGSVDIAFNNAGISPPDDDSILTTGLDAWRRVNDVNLTSVYLCCRAALPYMQSQGKGSIINTASFVAVMGAATSQIAYTASKGGVLAMSRELGVQFAREGIRVNALCPGPVNTPLLQELFAKDPERAARRLVHIPLGRFAEAEEIAAAVAFLASDDSSFMTASTFLVDGGISGAYVTPCDHVRAYPVPGIVIPWRLAPAVGGRVGGSSMAFGQQSGPPASAKQVQYLQALVAKAGHAGFRDARGPLGLTQRQASGKFTRDEASTLIDQLLQADPVEATAAGSSFEQTSAADRLESERAQALRGMPASLLADELHRRGWSTTAPE